MRVLPADAPLSSSEAWARLTNRLTASDWPDGMDHGPALGQIIDLLSRWHRGCRGGWGEAAAWAGAHDSGARRFLPEQLRRLTST